eukprot:CAMPEP_0114681390 /NCGR_PEP_ID=MMETSP0191-20121206/55319_1 /TAXON_ID=126664 /ORGANISM="Sorites sp." /LENGTH=518 /DNA_ID=CAMNT_0001959603 /DNA_START=55 /DNA_END=1612 /DNA_ORIENTATION=-
MESGSARNVLISNREVEIQNLKEIRDLPEKQKKGREKEIRAGAQFLQVAPRFPSRRGCKDLPWAILFLLTLALIGFVVYSLYGIDTELNRDADFKHHKTHDGLIPTDIWKDALTINFACVAGCVCGFAMAFFWVMAAKACPSPVVYISIYGVPIITIILGLGLLVYGFNVSQVQGTNFLISGGFFILVGLCQLACAMCCWARFIPFTIEVVEMVATVSNEHPCMVAVSALGGFFNAVWFLLLALGFAAFTMKHQEDKADQHKGVMGPVEFCMLLVLFWGSYVIHNVCHTTYCGVFSRWYFSTEGSYLLPSMRVALTTSFGSICFGTFIVAAVRSVQMLVQSIRVAAQEDGNIVGCVVALILECIIDFIGDMLEYFNEWVYVQCAIRGGTFCESARATCAMIACNGIKAIIGDLLVDRVVTLGILLSGVVGLGAGAVIAFTRDEVPDSHMSRSAVIIAGVLGGFFGGLVAGGGVMTIFSSGTKAIITCWAEEPSRLHEEHEFEDVHTEFNAKVQEYNSS